MGYAFARNGQLGFEWEHVYDSDIQDFIVQLKDQTARVIFSNANERALAKTVVTDIGLVNGYLESRQCAYILWDLTGDSTCFTGGFWSAGFAKMAFETTTWNIQAHRRDPFIDRELTDEGNYKSWAYWSTYYFMKTCADHDLGIQFEAFHV